MRITEVITLHRFRICGAVYRVKSIIDDGEVCGEFLEYFSYKKVPPAWTRIQFGTPPFAHRHKLIISCVSYNIKADGFSSSFGSHDLRRSLLDLGSDLEKIFRDGLTRSLQEINGDDDRVLKTKDYGPHAIDVDLVELEPGIGGRE